MKSRKYTPSKRVRSHIAKWEASDFAGLNAAFGGDAVGAKAIELMNMLGDKANAFTDNELDGLLSTYYNLSPKGFRRTLMPYIDAYAADLSDETRMKLDQAMRNRWTIAALKYLKGIKRRAAADADLMGLKYNLPIIEQPDAVRVKPVIPELNTRTTWSGAEDVSPYVTGRPTLNIRPRILLPTVEEVLEDSAGGRDMRRDPTEFRARFKAYKEGKMPYDAGRPAAIQEVDKSNADFAKRLRSNWRLEIWDWEGSGKAATHKIESSDNIVYPNVQTTEGGGLIDFTNPIWKGVVDPRQRAILHGDFVPMKTESDAIWFGPNYKKYYPGFKTGKLPKFAEGTEGRSYVYLTEDKHPIKFDEQGNLVDLITGDVGTMRLPEVQVSTANPKNYRSSYDPDAIRNFTDWLPLAGDAGIGIDIADAIKKDDYIQAGALGCMALLPPAIGKMLKRPLTNAFRYFVNRNRSGLKIDANNAQKIFDEYAKDWFNTQLTYRTPFRSKSRYNTVGDVIDYNLGLWGGRDKPLAELTDKQRYSLAKQVARDERFPKGSKVIHMDDTGLLPNNNIGFVPKDATNSNSPWTSSMLGQPEIWWKRANPYYNAHGYPSVQDIPRTIVSSVEDLADSGILLQGLNVLHGPGVVPFSAVEYGLQPNMFGWFDRIKFVGKNK